MKVSLVIPAYNEERFIEKCLVAVFRQVIPADEVIVVNNNSIDKTVEITKRFPVRIVHEKDQGMIPARNRGFDEAKFEIIAKIDADVLIGPDWIKKVKQNFKDKKFDALSGPISYYGSRLVTASHLPSHIYLKLLMAIYGGKGFLVGSNMAITKDVWGRVKFLVNKNDSKVHEDVDLSMNIHKINGEIGYDQSLIVKTSARRLTKNPSSFFVEYPQRLLSTFLINRWTQ